jgi:hypothetical protein
MPAQCAADKTGRRKISRSGFAAASISALLHELISRSEAKPKIRMK